jgi:hypothetical protein
MLVRPVDCAGEPIARALSHKGACTSRASEYPFLDQEKMPMRLAFTAFALLLAADAYAQDYSSSEYCDPWCSDSFARDCSYHTFQQCLAAASGTTITCYPNPFLGRCSRPSARDRSIRSHR